MIYAILNETLDQVENIAESYRGLGIALWEQKEYEKYNPKG